MCEFDKIRARAFDLLVSGHVTGVDSIWKHFGEINKLPNDPTKLQLIINAACKDAYEIAYEEFNH